MPPKRFAIDVGAGAGLLLVLGLVLLVDVLAPAGADAEIVDVKPLRLAVTPPEFDDIGKQLKTFGNGYRYDDISMDDVLDTEKLGKYDVVFLTSGYVPTHWTGKELRKDRRGGRVSAAKEDLAKSIRSSLQTYVGDGGTLYVSDWQFQLLAIAFEDLIDRQKVAKGKKGTVRADVVEPGLQRRIGSKIELHFDKDNWRPAAFAGPDVTTLLSGTFDTTSGRMTAPLLVRFPFKKGQVIFTSFHNEKQDSDTEKEFLRYLIFATLTAQTDARVHQRMVRGGFSPVDRNLLSASGRQQTKVQTYNCRGRRDLQFVLGFAERGAKLKLVVVSPDGKTEEKTGISTITIDVPRAKQGKWKYSATAIRVPHANFPFTLTVGEK